MANGKKNQKQQGKQDAIMSSPVPNLNLFKKLTPQQLAVITALLTNALDVNSILVDKDQTVQVVLEGSLRRKTKLDLMLKELSGMQVSELLDAIRRL